MKIFVCYSIVDRAVAEQLTKTLTHLYPPQKNSWSFPFLDAPQAIGKRRDWNEILDDIRECNVFIYILSKDSVESEYNQKLLKYAQNLSKPIMPLQTNRAYIPDELVSIQYVDMGDMSSEQQIIDSLERIRKGKYQTNVNAERPNEPGAIENNSKDKPKPNKPMPNIHNPIVGLVVGAAVYLGGAVGAAVGGIAKLGDELISSSNTNKVNEVEESENVNFHAYYSRSGIANKSNLFLVYVTIPDAVQDVKKDIIQFASAFRNQIPSPKETANVGVKEDTPLTIMLECEEQEFEPLAITKKWRPNWVRFEFDFTPSEELVGDTIIVRVSIRAYGVEIASIEKCAIDIVAQEDGKPALDPALADDTNPLIKAKFQHEQVESQTVEMYKKIFVSYAREDTNVVESYRLAQMAIGNDVFVDTYSIRTGENFEVALANAIDDADIFQLFWSENSSQSEYVGHEIDYALKVRCRDDECYGFMRPVYWRKPMPDPPTGLTKHHFAYVPFGLAGETLEWRLYNDEFWERMEGYFNEANITLKRTMRDLKQGQRAIYKRLDRDYTEELNEIIDSLKADQLSDELMQQTLKDIRKTLIHLTRRANTIDKNVKVAVEDLSEAIESELGLQQKLELALPVIPFFLDYKVELGAGSDVDLNAVWDELKQRWSALLRRSRAE